MFSPPFVGRLLEVVKRSSIWSFTTSHHLQSLRVTKLQEVLGQLRNVEVILTSWTIDGCNNSYISAMCNATGWREMEPPRWLSAGAGVTLALRLATGALFLGIFRRLASMCHGKIIKEDNVIQV